MHRILQDDKDHNYADSLNRFNSFCGKFLFDSNYQLSVGVERECFLLDKNGTIAPIASFVLQNIGKDNRFGHELSACQLEDRIGPCSISDVRLCLEQNESILKEAESSLGFGRLFQEVGPSDMLFDISPDPTGRYQRIQKSIPQDVLEAACRVIGTHVHIGMPDHFSALFVYNKVIQYVDELCQIGDFSNGERLKLYKKVAPKCDPKPYKTWHEFYQEAVRLGFDSNPRSSWTLIRISVHGTIEFRMFGATTDLNMIVGWANRCYNLCKLALLDIM